MCGGISDPDMTPDLPRVALAQRAPANSRYANGVGVSTPRWYDQPGGPPFSSSVWRFGCVEGFPIPGVIYVLHGCGETPRVPPLSDQPVGLGIPHSVGRYRPEGPSVTSPVRRGCRCMEGSMIGGWHLILPDGWCFYTVRGCVDPWCHRFNPPFVKVVDVWTDALS